MEKENQQLLDELLIVLVIYKMKIGDSPTFVSLCAAIQHENKTASLFIYDNSPEPQKISKLENWNIYYQQDASNSGVSKAYNEGFKKAKGLNKKWLMLADQDTTFPEDFFSKLSASKTNQKQSKLFVPMVRSGGKIISPFHFFFGKGWQLTQAQPKIYSLRKVKFINSGLVVMTDLFEKCNGYDERFPLDFSDLVFAEKILTLQEELVVIDCVCEHGLSSEVNSEEEMLTRFSYFQKASKLYGEIIGSSFFLLITRFMRALKLSFKFNSFIFLKIFMKEMN